MTRAALVSDVHWGARNDSDVIAAHQMSFWIGQFIPYILKEGINQVVFLGDIFDRRKFINFKTLDNAYAVFDLFEQHEIQVTCFVGNHDCYHRSSNHLNSVGLLLGRYPNVTILDHHKPTLIAFSHNQQTLCCPWIAPQNYEQTINALKTTTASTVFGHFEINGFEMVPGHVCSDGLDQALFKRFDLVCSGHYHLKSNIGKIHYLGTQFDMDWGDYGQTKGFHVFDDATKTIEFVPNPNKIFTKIGWHDGSKDDPKACAGKYVKLIVSSKTDEKAYQKFHKAVIESQPADLVTIEPNQVVTEVSEEDVRVLSTLDIIAKHVNELEIQSETRGQVTALMSKLYAEAMTKAKI